MHSFDVRHYGRRRNQTPTNKFKIIGGNSNIDLFTPLTICGGKIQFDGRAYFFQMGVWLNHQKFPTGAVRPTNQAVTRGGKVFFCL